MRAISSSCQQRIVERTLALDERDRRLARDFERYATTVAAFVRLAMIRVMLGRSTRASLVHDLNFINRL